MFGILLSVANVVLGFVMRSIIAKFFAYFIMWFVTTEFIGVLQNVGILPSASSLTGAFGGIGGDVWYFLDLCACSYGIPLLVSAYATRFVIRRIPMIG